ncbi:MULTISPECIES: lipid-A-disaccharide synthase N-terminal domain-containing protein [Christiangramia]|uniref:Membrane protein containing the N-terminal domain of lipid-A-disaccharide synthase n=2 Tax=Christiangramia forsetii TaxID=411153 RepID=A0M0P7_CHRFK|nr:MULTISPECIES: lipid-A-disaccharide synthase N-terminal domain-containing protein [Christiangramia]WPY97350.1 lipid-A-disaccharide synthase N-terminal domain-containing protein [Christiangramia sp. OXR-203]GGG40399.1 lauroyl acyltransferase [Christiangramia forsetii]CAL66192.1 membrane protein containing the N-terminal domain of lipid-A-disaccharide synthase [Christiangramia forsetii KT0803]
MSSWLIYTIGFSAQLLFSGRSILQWIISEKQKKVLTPVLFWQLSLIASFLLFMYGYLRNDFAIMLGQILTYFIYIRNMHLQNQWLKFPKMLRWFLYIFPFIILYIGYNNHVYDRAKLFQNDNIPLWLLLLGIIAQVIFTLRFVYQWFYSEKRKVSSLPLGFWFLSLFGSLMILIYAIFRKDPVLLLGHSLGIFLYVRNILILKTESKIL